MKKISKHLLRSLMGAAGLLTFTACYGPGPGEWTPYTPDNTPSKDVPMNMGGDRSAGSIEVVPQDIPTDDVQEEEVVSDETQPEV